MIPVVCNDSAGGWGYHCRNHKPGSTIGFIRGCRRSLKAPASPPDAGSESGVGTAGQALHGDTLIRWQFPLLVPAHVLTSVCGSSLQIIRLDLPIQRGPFDAEDGR